MPKKAWSGRFAKKENPLMESFNASISFDQRLYREDIQGSLVHAKMLKKIGVLSQKEYEDIQKGLIQIQTEIETKKFLFSIAQEDIHMAVESRLRELIGEAAGKLHSARSRNDQVALDIKLYVRHHTKSLCALITDLQNEFLKLAEQNTDAVLPGYTHLQRAQPILLSHHLLAYFEMLQRDHSRFSDNENRLKESPLGAGALAGTTFPIDREMTAKEFGFLEPTHNSLDSVSDRDFVLDFLYAASLLMMHLSRFAEEIVLWNSQEFGFVKLPQEFCTGSSMMPQKINPDAFELIRGKTGRIYGNLLSLLTTMKALPLAYNKDMQEDKEPLFDTSETLTLCLKVLIALLPEITFNKEQMRLATKKGFILATDVADYLVKKGLPFRKAHGVVGQLVQTATEREIGFEDFKINELQEVCDLFSEDIFEILSLETSVAARNNVGGTAPSQVQKEIKRAKDILSGRKG